MRTRHTISFLFLIFCIVKTTAQAPDFAPNTFQSYLPAPSTCLSHEARTNIKSELISNIADLKDQGIISDLTQRTVVPLGWPLRNAVGFDDIDFHGISYFVDHDSAFPGQLQDYNCGQRCFDSTTGFNHAGTDIFLWPFSWSMMHEGRVDVVSAADGVIVGKIDGNYDLNCTWSDTASWNAVYIRHNDGSVAWYGHLKKNSLTFLPVGASVSQGDYLGKVGSSGASQGPHLHFEVYEQDDLVNLVDPFEGSCNMVNTSSSWIDQRPYYDSGINRVSTHSAYPATPSCPQPEIKYEQNDFCGGDEIFFMVFFRDLVENQTIYHQIIKPDGTVVHSWESALQGFVHLSAASTYEYSVIPTNPDEGVWQYRVDFLGTTVIHDFNVCISTDLDSVDIYDEILMYPNPTSEFLFIEYNNSLREDLNITIHNVDGKLLLNQNHDDTQSKIELDITTLPSGIFFVSILESGQVLTTQRIIKI